MAKAVEADPIPVGTVAMEWWLYRRRNLRSQLDYAHRMTGGVPHKASLPCCRR